MLRFTRPLMAAKTAHKATAKGRAKVKKVKEKKVKEEVDLTKWHHSTWRGTSLVQLVGALPRPAQPEFEHSDTWLHKYGYGLKFYREDWSKYPEPSYWTLVKFKPRMKQQGVHAKAWGFHTWRGVTEPVPRAVPGLNRRDWRLLLEPGTRLGPSQEQFWEAPAITPESDPAASTQIPEGLEGTAEGSWPYPWGPGGRNFHKAKPEAEAEAAEEGESAAASSSSAATAAQ